MNYDDASQQSHQQFYVQRMPAQQQRMMNPMGQNQQNMQQQQIMRQQQYAGMMHPHQQQPQQVMVRMAHQQGMNEDSPNPYQQQQTQIRDIIQTFPTTMQNHINSETNPERKKHLFQVAMKQQQQQQQQMFEQQMQHGGMPMRMPMNISSQRLPIPQNAGGGGGMVYPPGQQIVIQQQGGPTQIQRIPSQGSFAQSPNVQPQIYVANTNQMGQTRVAPMQPMPINQPQYVQQQHQISQQPQMQQNVQQSLPHQQMQKQQSIPLQQQKSIGQLEQQPPSSSGMMPMNVVGQMKKIQNSQIPQSNDQLQSANSNEEYQQAASIESKNISMLDQNQQKQPRSVGTPLSQMGQQQQQQNEAETTEYKTLFDRLRTYHGDIKRILDRLNIDYPGEMKLKSSLINVIQVMEGTRKAGVNCQLLRKLLSNVQTVLEQYNISRHLIGAAKKLNALSANARESLANESIFIDPWSSVRHLQIKLPSEIANIPTNVEETKNEEANVTKRDILENGPPQAKRSLLTLMAESFSPAKKYKVNCLDGSELCLNSTLSMAITEAINNEFSVDFHCDDDQIQQPVSSTASTVQARFTFMQKFNVEKFGIAARNPQLDLLLPVDYPKSSIQIVLKNNAITESLDNLMEQIDASAVNMHSLAEILEAWKACLALVEE